MGGRADELHVVAGSRRSGTRSSRTSRRRVRRSSRRRFPSSPATSTRCSTARASRRRTSRASPRSSTQRHPSWTPQQMKSALMSTAGPAFADTSLTQEASVLVEGAGLVRVAVGRPAARSSPIRSRSRSATSLPAAARTRKSISVTVSDAGDGAGTWIGGGPAAGRVGRRDGRGGAGHDRAGRHGGHADRRRARPRARVQGDNFGFVLLRRGSDVRRIPYAFSVSRSSLTGAPVTPLKTLQSGDTRAGEDRARVYRWPTSPFSILGIFGVDPSVNDDGKEKIYSLDITKQAVNAGVVVVQAGAEARRVDHGAPELEPADPSVVHGLARRERRARLRGDPRQRQRPAARLPLLDRRRRAASSCRPGATTSRSTPAATSSPGARSPGTYTLRSWVNDVQPPTVQRPHEDALERAADDRREDHRREVGRRPALAPALLRTVDAANVGRRDALRPGDRASRRSRSRARRSRSSRARSSCRSSPPTSRRRRTSTRSPTARSRTRASRGSAPRP